MAVNAAPSGKAPPGRSRFGAARLVSTKVDLKHLADGCRTDAAPHKHLKRD
jgi:hypothetical protein